MVREQLDCCCLCVFCGSRRGRAGAYCKVFEVINNTNAGEGELTNKLGKEGKKGGRKERRKEREMKALSNVKDMMQKVKEMNM